MSIKRKFITVGVVIISALVAVAAYGIPKSFSGPDHDSEPPITWSQQKLEINIGVSETFTQLIQVSSSADLADLTLAVSGRPNPYVTVQTPSPFSLHKGVPQQIALLISIPETSILGEFEDAIRVQQLNRTIPRVLEVKLHIRTGFVDPNLNVGITVPDVGLQTRIRSSNDTKSASYDIQTFSAADSMFVTVLGVQLFDNPNLSDISTWFETNVDQDGSLLRAHTFHLATLSDGRAALIRTGPVPDDFDGQIQYEYALSLDKKKVIAITQAQDHSFGEFGLSLNEIQSLEQKIVQNVEFFN
jgi:hypothetical protein